LLLPCNEYIKNICQGNQYTKYSVKINFHFICVVYVYKPFLFFRDRRRIKKRIAAKAKQRLEQENNSASVPQQTEVMQTDAQTNNSSLQNSNAATIACSISTNQNKVKVPIDLTFSRNGVDNHVFVHSNPDIKISDGGQRRHSCKSKSATANDCTATNKTFASRTPKAENGYGGNSNSNGFYNSSRCIRRYSYDIAVFEHSWLPIDPPSFASSEIIIKTYCYGNNKDSPVLSKTTVGFENKAFSKDGSRILQ